MWEIKAYIKPNKLHQVAQALKKVEKIRSMSTTEINGICTRGEDDVCYPDVDDLVDFARYSKIEIFYDGAIIDGLVSIIEKNAYTGLRGDGEIYVSKVEKAIRIGKGAIC
jgi:nitrogen regulatory protein P-II 1